MSLTLAAHAHPVPPFDGLFYATVATVIPVLFLAIAVQGTAYQELLKIVARAVHQAQNIREGDAQSPLRPIAVAGTAVGMAYGVLLYGVVAEFLALASLGWQRQVVARPLDYLWACGFLLATAAAPPTVALFRSMVAMPEPPPASTGEAAEPDSGPALAPEAPAPEQQPSD
jgi:hypothetical protein